jgi:hypothetical protein
LQYDLSFYGEYVPGFWIDPKSNTKENYHVRKYSGSDGDTWYYYRVTDLILVYEKTITYLYGQETWYEYMNGGLTEF